MSISLFFLASRTLTSDDHWAHLYCSMGIAHVTPWSEPSSPLSDGWIQSVMFKPLYLVLSRLIMPSVTASLGSTWLCTQATSMSLSLALSLLDSPSLTLCTSVDLLCSETDMMFDPCPLPTLHAPAQPRDHLPVPSRSSTIRAFSMDSSYVALVFCLLTQESARTDTLGMNTAELLDRRLRLSSGKKRTLHARNRSTWAGGRSR